MALLTLAEIRSAQWLKADDSSTITLDGGAVSQWSDKSGNARHATQSVAGSRPTVAAAAIDGTDDFFDVSFAQSLPCHVFIVLKDDSLGTGTRVIYQSDDVSSPYAPSLEIGTDAPDYALGVYWGEGWAKKAATGYRTSYLAEFRLTASTVGLRKDGGTEETASHTNTALLNWDTINTATAGQQCLCDIAEIFVVHGALATEARQIIEGALLWDWGLEASLPVGHPYELAAPVSSQAAVSGQLTLGSSMEALSSSPLAISGQLTLSGDVEASTYNASMTGTLHLSGTMDAGLANATVGGALRLSGVMLSP